jgi:hypothetical protein
MPEETGYSHIINKLLYTPNGQLVISVLFGLSIAFVFKPVCKKNCNIYKAPPVSDIVDKVFKLDDSCYTYTPIPQKCKNGAIEH